MDSRHGRGEVEEVEGGKGRYRKLKDWIIKDMEVIKEANWINSFTFFTSFFI
jgi:hypothetical protein